MSSLCPDDPSGAGLLPLAQTLESKGVWKKALYEWEYGRLRQAMSSEVEWDQFLNPSITSQTPGEDDTSQTAYATESWLEARLVCRVRSVLFECYLSRFHAPSSLTMVYPAQAEPSVDAERAEHELCLDDEFYTLEFDADESAQQRKMQGYRPGLPVSAANHDSAHVPHQLDALLNFCDRDPDCVALHQAAAASGHGHDPEQLARERADKALSGLKPQPQLGSTRSDESSADNIAAARRQTLQQALEQLLQDLKNYEEHSYPFLSRVKKCDAPDYYEVIAKPMDLAMMTRNLRANKYTTRAAFDDDLQLMYRNCRQYNTDPNSIYLVHCQHMEIKSQELLSALPDDLCGAGFDEECAPLDTKSTRSEACWRISRAERKYELHTLHQRKQYIEQRQRLSLLPADEQPAYSRRADVMGAIVGAQARSLGRHARTSLSHPQCLATGLGVSDCANDEENVDDATFFAEQLPLLVGTPVPEPPGVFAPGSLGSIIVGVDDDPSQRSSNDASRAAIEAGAASGSSAPSSSLFVTVQSMLRRHSKPPSIAPSLNAIPLADSIAHRLLSFAVMVLLSHAGFSVVMQSALDVLTDAMIRMFWNKLGRSMRVLLDSTAVCPLDVKELLVHAVGDLRIGTVRDIKVYLQRIGLKGDNKLKSLERQFLRLIRDRAKIDDVVENDEEMELFCSSSMRIDRQFNNKTFGRCVDEELLSGTRQKRSWQRSNSKDTVPANCSVENEDELNAKRRKTEA